MATPKSQFGAVCNGLQTTLVKSMILISVLGLAYYVFKIRMEPFPQVEHIVILLRELVF